MTSRRSLLSLFTGAATAASAGVRPKDLLAAAQGAPIGYEIGGATLGSAPIDSDHYHKADPFEPFREAMWKYRRQLGDELDNSSFNTNPEYLPPHIRTKRSWSAAYKMSEWRKEEAARIRARNLIHNDEFFFNFLRDRGIL